MSAIRKNIWIITSKCWFSNSKTHKLILNYFVRVSTVVCFLWQWQKQASISGFQRTRQNKPSRGEEWSILQFYASLQKLVAHALLGSPSPLVWKTFLWDCGLLGTLRVLHVLAAGEWSASAFIKLQNKLKTFISVCGVDNRESASSYNNLAEANGFTLSRVSRFQLRVLKAVRSFPRVFIDVSLSDLWASQNVIF